jgi:beta-ribofuranosylaminobenzene 5'-phosphate synthase
MSVLVTAPARLHLGMFSFGRPDVRQFGGVGLMVSAPATKLEFTPAPEFQVSGRQADRARQSAHYLVASGLLDALPPCHLRILETPPPHAGLGSGTQLALAVARGLLSFAGLPSPPAIDLAHRLGRGRRSAVGTYGFDHGGLIVEAGRVAGVERIAGVESTRVAGVESSSPRQPLIARIELPAHWRFLLLVPRTEHGVFGQNEETAFDRLPPVPEETTAQLCREVLLELLPAAQTRDFNRFAESVYRFGRLAGTCFSAAQHGPFASRAVEERIETLRALGIRGAAQTSWGPTVLAALPSPEQAESAAAEIARRTEAIDCEVVIAAPNNRGAVVESAA